MSISVAWCQHGRIETNAIIPHAYREGPLTKDALHFHPLGTCMSEGIADAFPNDPISLITHDRLEIDHMSLHQHAIIWRSVLIVEVLELLAQMRERLRQVSAQRCGCPQLADGLPALIDRRQASLDCNIEVICSLAGAVRQKPADGFEPEHHSLKSL